MDDIASALADGIERALPGWVEGSVARLVEAWTGAPPDESVRTAAAAAGQRAPLELGGQVRALLAADIDAQRTTPLAIVRTAVDYPAEVLRAAGVPPVERDDFAEHSFPDDDYDLTPAALADLDPALADLGLRWGAAKAWEHKHRHGKTGGVVAFVPDLMDRSRITAATSANVEFVSRPDDLVDCDAATIVVDLGRPGVLDVLPRIKARRVIAFGSHVDRDLLDHARAAGVDDVMPRSAFFSRVAELLN